MSMWNRVKVGVTRTSSCLISGSISIGEVTTGSLTGRLAGIEPAGVMAWAAGYLAEAMAGGLAGAVTEAAAEAMAEEMAGT